MSRPNYPKLSQAPARDDRHSIEHRWRHGRAILTDPEMMSASGKSLKHGAMDKLIAIAKAAGVKLSEREIQWRIQCARAYKTINEIRRSTSDFADWTALVEAGFPVTYIDESVDEIDDIETVGASDESPTEWDQDPLFDIPGFKAVVKVRGRKVDLSDLTVREAVDYRDMCHEMHANFGRTVAQVESSVEVMLRGCGGDLEANAIEAWRAGAGAA